MHEKKNRIVIELQYDDYEALLVLKNLLGITWKDIIIAGAIAWSDAVNLEQKLDDLRTKFREILEEKN
jgi:hypothetical protein